MTGIRNYEVTIPPTSGEVKERVIAAMANCTLFAVSGRSETTDPSPNEDVDLELRVMATQHPRDNSMRVIGETATGNNVVLQISANPDTPATFAMVFDFQEQA